MWSTSRFRVFGNTTEKKKKKLEEVLGTVGLLKLIIMAQAAGSVQTMYVLCRNN